MKLTKEGWAVIEGDTYLSNDIIVQKRLDVAKDFLEQFRQYIPEGGVVVDVGASLGDYTMTFLEMVGPSGMVIAFEPNPPVEEALRFNLRDTDVRIFPIALGATDNTHGRVIVDTNNSGASRVEFDVTGAITIYSLDGCHLAFSPTDQTKERLDFLKIDAEGWEPLILDGAMETINRFRPVMLIEVNTWPLGKMGFVAEDVFSRLDALNYNFPRFDGPYGDILCVPKERA